MAIMEERNIKNQNESTQNIIVENRRRISVSGVEDVDSFDERDMILQTNLGTLSIKGEGLHINKFNVETGELIIDGDIDELIYHNDGYYDKKSSLFSKIFG